MPDATFLTRKDLDLADPATVAPALVRWAPAAIINCAAYTHVDRAEADEDHAHTINADSVGEMAAVARAMGIPFVTFSTDYVFDGSADTPYVESSPTSPVNAYGRTKLAGEQMALETYPGSLVIRTSWVISGTHPNFVATMLRLVDERELRVVDDQVGCPTVAADLAAATRRAIERRVTGILHLTNTGATTWFELARTAVGLAGRDVTRISPCSTDEYPTPAPRPRFSVLGSERRASVGVTPLPHWRDSLREVVARQLAR